MIGTLGRYWHTVRYLKPIQIFARVWFRAYRPRPDLRPAPPLRLAAGAWVAPMPGAQTLFSATECEFLGERADIGSARIWNDPNHSKLWLYNLHYFDDLNAVGADQRVAWHGALIDRWIAENPPGFGNGWEPYTVSRRIVNWIKWSRAGHTLKPEWVHSLAVQARWLARRLEWHLLGNHLFVNAKALVYAGLFFESAQARAWLDKGAAILQRELKEQVLADGGHFERSPMYHALFWEDVLDLINAARTWPDVLPATVNERLRGSAHALHRWMNSMVHPDGGIAFFNDASFGIAPDCQVLQDYAAALKLDSQPPPKLPVMHLQDSGYVRVQLGPVVAFLDVAAIGPDYMPGHAHADTLSMELSCDGRRLIVNSGTSQYGTSPERVRERGTAAHSTVEIDGQDSSEVWGGFRVARRAYPLDLELEDQGEALEVSCAHTGYQRLPGNPLHRRTWRFSPSSLNVSDRIEGRFGKALARYHLHPDVAATGVGNRIHLGWADGRQVECEVIGGRARLAESVWHPYFGQSLPSACLEVEFEGAKLAVNFRW